MKVGIYEYLKEIKTELGRHVVRHFLLREHSVCSKHYQEDSIWDSVFSSCLSNEVGFAYPSSKLPL